MILGFEDFEIIPGKRRIQGGNYFNPELQLSTPEAEEPDYLLDCYCQFQFRIDSETERGECFIVLRLCLGLYSGFGAAEVGELMLSMNSA